MQELDVYCRSEISSFKYGKLVEIHKLNFEDCVLNRKKWTQKLNDMSKIHDMNLELY